MFCICLVQSTCASYTLNNNGKIHGLYLEEYLFPDNNCYY